VEPILLGKTAAVAVVELALQVETQQAHRQAAPEALV
jgi:hypothetical protein